MSDPETLTMRATVIGGIRYAEDFAVIWRGLDAIPIEFDLMYPAVAAGHILDGGSERGLDEAGVGGLDADGCRFPTLERHAQTNRIGRGSWTS